MVVTAKAATPFCEYGYKPLKCLQTEVNSVRTRTTLASPCQKGQRRHHHAFSPEPHPHQQERKTGEEGVRLPSFAENVGFLLRKHRTCGTDRGSFCVGPVSCGHGVCLRTALRSRASRRDGQSGRLSTSVSRGHTGTGTDISSSCRGPTFATPWTVASQVSPELAQIHAAVSDAVQPPHPCSPSSPFCPQPFPHQGLFQ